MTMLKSNLTPGDYEITGKLGQKLKPNFLKQMEEGEVEWAGKWRNVYFSKDGRTYSSQRLQDTKMEAVQRSKTIVLEALAGKWVGFGPEGKNPVILIEDYSHAIQIPIKGD